MKKAGLLFAVLFVLTQFASAQFKLGVRAGYNTQSIDPSTLIVKSGGDLNNLGLSIKNADYGAQFGAFARIGDKWYVQPELMFNTNSVNFKVQDLNSGNEVIGLAKERYNYVDLPLLIGRRFGPLRIETGPVAHFFISSSSDLKSLAGYQQQFKEAAYGWQAGIGLDVWRFGLDARWEGNFDRFGNHIVINGQQLAFDRTNRFLVTLSFALIK